VQGGTTPSTRSEAPADETAPDAVAQRSADGSPELALEVGVENTEAEQHHSPICQLTKEKLIVWAAIMILGGQGYSGRSNKGSVAIGVTNELVTSRGLLCSSYTGTFGQQKDRRRTLHVHVSPLRGRHLARRACGVCGPCASRQRWLGTAEEPHTGAAQACALAWCSAWEWRPCGARLTPRLLWAGLPRLGGGHGL